MSALLAVAAARQAPVPMSTHQTVRASVAISSSARPACKQTWCPGCVRQVGEELGDPVLGHGRRYHHGVPGHQGGVGGMDRQLVRHPTPPEAGVLIRPPRPDGPVRRYGCERLPHLLRSRRHPPGGHSRIGRDLRLERPELEPLSSTGGYDRGHPAVGRPDVPGECREIPAGAGSVPAPPGQRPTAAPGTGAPPRPAPLGTKDGAPWARNGQASSRNGGSTLNVSMSTQIRIVV